MTSRVIQRRRLVWRGLKVEGIGGGEGLGAVRLQVCKE